MSYASGGNAVGEDDGRQMLAKNRRDNTKKEKTKKLFP
jgi:hypothetical protein